MFQVTVLRNGQKEVLALDAPAVLSDLLRLHGAPLSLPCGGNGRCGKCRILAEGNLSPVSEQEARLLGAEDISRGVRLACLTTVCGDAAVTVGGEEAMGSVLSSGEMPDFERKPASSGLGVAVDIGTTTVAAYLYDLSTCTLLRTAGAKNPQAAFGADVISRIEQSMAGHAEELSRLIVEEIDRMVGALAEEAGVGCAKIDQLIITGNTTMLYLLTGRPVHSLAAAPFVSDTLFGERLTGGALGLASAPDADVFLPRCMSAFVGADITCAVLASDMLSDGKPSLLVDIGTNGEMALHNGGELFCCSTAAGPAFEGAGITMGMPALPGAINKVYLQDGKFGFSTLSGQPAKGICGSGLLDAVAVLLQVGVLDETGLLAEEDHDYLHLICEWDDQPAFRFEGADVLLTQKDIRAVQLAKSAIRAGMETLLHENGLTPEDLSTLYIAGGFGSFIDVESAAAIGLIPKALAGKVKVLGNAAGSGASMLLQNADLPEQSTRLADGAQTVDLSTNPFFMDQYVSGMMFE